MTTPYRDSRCVDTLDALLDDWSTVLPDADTMFREIDAAVRQARPLCESCGNRIERADATRFCSRECVQSAAISKANVERREFAEEVEDLLGHGMTPSEIVNSLGIKAATVHQRLRRAERLDLAKTFAPLVRRDRMHPCPGCGRSIDFSSKRCLMCATRDHYGVAS